MRSANGRRRTSRGMVKERKGNGAGNSELTVDKIQLSRRLFGGRGPPNGAGNAVVEAPEKKFKIVFSAATA